MGLFSLGHGIELERELPFPISQAYRLGYELIEAFREDGLDVRFLQEDPPEKLSARLRDEARGTDLRAEVVLKGSDRGCHLQLSLRGQIFVGGVAGFFASQSRVSSEARKRLTQLLDQSFDPQRVPPEIPRAPVDEPQTESLEAPGSLDVSQTPSESVETSPAPTATMADPVPLAQEPMATAIPTMPADEVSSPGIEAAPGSVERRLKVLTTMHERGFISAEDYQEKRREILDSL